MTKTIEEFITTIYKNKDALQSIKDRLGDEWENLTPPDWYHNHPALESFDQTAAILITYADQFNDPDKTPLASLRAFLDEILTDCISTVHILPFFCYSSDDGFSISDYRKINPGLGTWEDIKALSKKYRIMADLVLNHCSVSHEWFQAFLNDEDPFNDFFITVSPDEDLSQVLRPRALPLTHSFTQNDTDIQVWTTFSKDQVDLNFANPLVLAEMLSILRFYITQGISIIRLDAVAYVWKERGTSCIHHQNTHRIVKLIRAFLDAYAPWVLLITETNVPHRENISYFGEDDEAHLVYQFSLAPLLLHTMRSGSTQQLQQWAADLEHGSDTHGFFNFAASHDGIGLLPAHGILSSEDIHTIADHVVSLGGYVSYKDTPHGKIPYELNCNFLSALADQGSTASQKSRIFLISQALLLSFPGIPGIYAHSIIGSENWYEGAQSSGIPRRINREKLSYDTLVQEITDASSLRNLVLSGYKKLLRARAESCCFSPNAPFTVLRSDSSLFCCLRGPIDSQTVLCVFNCTPYDQVLKLRKKDLHISKAFFYSLIEQEQFFAQQNQHNLEVSLQAYEILWLSYTQG